MATVTWESPTAWADCVAVASMSAIANNGGVLSASVITNGTTRNLYADVSIRLASFTPTAGGHIAMYILPMLDDGTTYADGTTTTTATALPTVTHFAGALALRAVAAAQNGLIRGIIIPPGDFKWYFLNRSGATLATTTTANIVKFRTYSEDVV